MSGGKVYHVVVAIGDDFGKMSMPLFFPTADLRRQFCLTHADLCRRVGRRPLIATPGDLDRTRLNLAFYRGLEDFVPIWDAYFSQKP